QIQHHLALPELSGEQILLWAEEHKKRTGEWPQCKAGPVVDAPGETWSGLNAALEKGMRGLSGGSALAQLLAQRRSVPNRADLPPLTVEQIMLWAEAHYKRTGQWPKSNGGQVVGAPGETWSGVNAALRVGNRGLPGGSRLSLLFPS